MSDAGGTFGFGGATLIDGSGKQKEIGQSSKPNSCNFCLPIVTLVPAMRIQRDKVILPI